MRTAVISLLMFALLLGSAHRGHAWLFQFDEEGGRDIPQELHVGPAGELYVASTIETYAGALFKLDPATGSTVWEYDFDVEPDMLYDSLVAVDTDAAGNVYAAGSINLDYDVVRLDPVTAGEVWHTTLSGTGRTSYDFARAVAADGFGGVVVTGGLQDHDNPFGPDFAAVRYDADTGAVLWRKTIYGGAVSDNFGRGSRADDVAIASNGDAIVVGHLTVALPGEVNDDRLLMAVRFARDDGHEVWRWTYRPGPNFLGENFTRQVVLDANDDVILCGTLQGVPAAVFKLDGATGTELWRFPNSTERTQGVAVDAAGDVFVAGSTVHAGVAVPTHADVTVSKLDGTTGAVLWRTQFPGTGWSEAYDVAVTAGQDVIAVGSRRGMVSARKLAGSDGHVLWTRESNPLPDVASYWFHVGLDGAGHVFTAGSTYGPPRYAPEDLYVAGFDETTGAGIGCGNGVLDTGETCDDGNSADFDGCSATCTVELCSDGTVDPDEQCDDGGHVSGDGCDAQCNWEGCGDGELGPGENCDDRNRTSGDLCSATCQIEICETPNIASVSSVKLRKLGGLLGDERLSLRMQVVTTTGTTPVQLIVEDLGAGGTPLIDLSYRTNALGGITPLQPGCDPHTDVFHTDPRGDSYRNGSNTLPPDCTPGSASGFRRMTVKVNRKVPGGYAVKADFQNVVIATPVGPLRAMIVLGESLEAPFAGVCSQSAFTPAQCTPKSSSIYICQ